MHRIERRRIRASPRMAAAFVLALTLTVTTVPAGGGHAAPARATVKRVGQVTWMKGDVSVGRIPVAKTRNLRTGDVVTIGSNGEAKLHVTLKSTDCTVWSNTQLRVRPKRKVIYNVVNYQGDLTCGTTRKSLRELASITGPRASFNVKLRDPVFSISVRRKGAVVKVSRGSVILSGRSGLRGAVVVARKQQSVVPTGADPRGVQPYRPTGRERAAFRQLESRLPALQDTTPPATKFLKTPPRSTTSTSATFVFRANEAHVSFSCSLDGAAFLLCTNPATFRGLSAGGHRLSVRATDLEGNTGKPAIRTWTIRGGTADRFRQIIARNATNVRLEVDSEGRALVTYRSKGSLRRVLAFGAINAIPPTQDRDQVNFVLLYGAAPIRNVCKPYSGPPLAWLVVACTAPDGTHWALQSFQRALPNFGADPTAVRAAWELWLSHWSGPLAQLELKTDWTRPDPQGVRHDHLYGRLTYLGQPVHGFKSTPAGRPLDPFGRNIYVDTFNSEYGPDRWERENSFLAHRPTGAFCYGLWHRSRPVSGEGDRYRATVVGPGVTPIVMWEGPAPGPYDPAKDEAANLEQQQLFAPGKPCPNSR
jgi:hypothetical protein